MRIEILDDGYIEYVEHWGSEERIIEAARMSTGKGFMGWEPTWECTKCRATFEGEVVKDVPCACDRENFKKISTGDRKLLNYLYEHKHATPFEMAGVVIEVKAPLFVFREWHRHRTQSYNEMSARYIPLPNENYLPDIENLLNRAHEALSTTNRQANNSGKILTREQAEEDLGVLYNYYSFGQSLYERFLSHGWPKEMARIVTPVARYSRMRASANLRNWLAFLTLRSTPQAQYEIRVYAEALEKIIEKYFPRTYSLFCKDRKK